MIKEENNESEIKEFKNKEHATSRIKSESTYINIDQRVSRNTFPLHDEVIILAFTARYFKESLV